MIWISTCGADIEWYPKIVDPLRALPVELRSRRDLSPGGEVAAGLTEEWERAAAVVVILSPAWLAEVWDVEHKLLQRWSKRARPLWIFRLKPCSPPAELAGLPSLPLGGRPIVSLPLARQYEALLQLPRFVADRCEFPAPRDDLYETESRYRQQSRQRLEQLTLRGLAGFHHPDQARTIPFDSVYVVPVVSLLRPPGGHDRRSLQAIEQDLASSDLTRQERQALYEQRELFFIGEREPRLDVHTALEQHRRLFVLGKPGSGKTSLLHALALHHLRQTKLVPIYLKLATLVPKSRVITDFKAKIIHHLRKSDQALAAALEEWLQRGRILLLLDGADEVPEEHRSKLLRMLEDLLQAEPALRCVVTSRPYAHCFMNDKAVAHLRIEGLNTDQINAFVGKHRPLLASTPSGTADTELLLRRVDQNPALRDLARTPLLLLLLCLIDAEGIGFPAQMVQFYQRAVDTLLRTWGQTRDAQPVLSEVEATAVRRAVAGVAGWMHDGGRPILRRAELIRHLVLAVQPKSRSKEQLAERYVQSLSYQAGLLQEQAPDEYAFLHLTFREYLTAVDLVETRTYGEAHTHRDEEHWHPVLRFLVPYLALVERLPEEAARILRNIAAPPEGLRGLVDPYLPLGASCLGSGAGLPVAVREDFFLRLCRAAMLPLAATRNAFVDHAPGIELLLTEATIIALSPLRHHQSVQVREAMVRLVWRGTQDSSRALRVCTELLADAAPQVYVYAALGIIAAKQPISYVDYLLQRLSGCILDKVGAADAAAALLPRAPALMERLFQASNSGDDRASYREDDITAAAAILLSLLYPENRGYCETLFIGVQRSSEKSQCALLRAALCSPRTARWLIEKWLALDEPPSMNFTPGGDKLGGLVKAIVVRSDMALQALVAALGLRAVGEEETSPPGRAEKLIGEMASQYPPPGTESEQERVRATITKALSAFAQGAEPPALVRVARLLGKWKASAESFAAALGPCLEATQPTMLRRQAITLARSEGRADLAIRGLFNDMTEPTDWLPAHRAMQQLLANQKGKVELVPLLEPWLRSPLRWVRLSAVLLLADLHALPPEVLDASLRPYCEDDDPLKCQYAAAAMYQAQIALAPEEVSSTLAIGLGGLFLRWKSQDKTDEIYGRGEPWGQTGWRMDRTARPPFAQWCLEGLREMTLARAPGLNQVLTEMFDFLCKRYPLRTRIEWSYYDNCKWLAEVLLAAPALLDRLAEGLVHPDLAEQDMAETMLRAAIHSSRTDQAGAPQALIDALFLRLPAEPTPIRWKLGTLLYYYHSEDPRARAVFDRFTALENPVALRYHALGYIDDKSAVDQEEILRSALTADDLELRVQAGLDLWMRMPAAHAVITAALRPCLAVHEDAALRLRASALLSMLPEADGEAIAHALVGCLEERRMLPWMDERLISQALDHLHKRRRRTGTSRQAQRQGPRGVRLGRRRDAFEVINFGELYTNRVAAVLLFYLERQHSELRRHLAQWLTRSAPPVIEEKARYRRTFRLSEDHRHHHQLQVEYNLALALLRRIGGSEVVLDETLAVWATVDPYEAWHRAVRLRCDGERFLRALLLVVLSDMYDQRHYDCWTWMVKRAQRNLATRTTIVCLLREHIVAGSPEVKLSSAVRLCDLNEVDDLVARTAAEAAVACRHFFSRQDQEWALLSHPRVQKELISFIDNDNLEIWTTVTRLLRGEDGTQKSTALVAALRRRLRRAQLDLRLDAALMLQEMGELEEGDVQLLKPCLEVPLDWVGLWYGDGLRTAAAKLLWRAGAVSVAEVLAAMLPVLVKPDLPSHKKDTVKFLFEIKACREPCCFALCEFLGQTDPTRLGYWDLLNCLRQTGLAPREVVTLTLRYVVDGASWDRERALLNLCYPELTKEERAAQEPEESKELRAATRSLFGVAKWLAERSSLPEAVVEDIATELGLDSAELLRLPEGFNAMRRLQELLTHAADDSPLRRFARSYLFFRCAAALGVLPDQIVRTDSYF